MRRIGDVVLVVVAARVVMAIVERCRKRRNAVAVWCVFGGGGAYAGAVWRL